MSNRPKRVVRATKVAEQSASQHAFFDETPEECRSAAAPALASQEMCESDDEFLVDVNGDAEDEGSWSDEARAPKSVSVPLGVIGFLPFLSFFAGQVQKQRYKSWS